MTALSMELPTARRKPDRMQRSKIIVRAVPILAAFSSYVAAMVFQTLAAMGLVVLLTGLYYSGLLPLRQSRNEAGSP
jgi:hypothetical protein